jgi:hypothetical protein
MSQISIKKTIKYGKNDIFIISTRVLLHNKFEIAGNNRRPASNPEAAKGLLIYNTTDKCVQFWNGTK